MHAERDLRARLARSSHTLDTEDQVGGGWHALKHVGQNGQLEALHISEEPLATLSESPLL